jgi:hypothetical protein
MRPTSEQLQQARSLVVEEDLLAQTREKIEDTGGETEDYYAALFSILVQARAMYKHLFFEIYSLPYHQDKNQIHIRVFLSWTALGIRRCLDLIPTDVHWDASGSQMKKTELEVRRLQQVHESELLQHINPPARTINSIKKELACDIAAGETVNSYLGGLSAFSIAYNLLFDDVTRAIRQPANEPSFLPVIDAYIKATLDHMT